jgi:hypothetical protein
MLSGKRDFCPLDKPDYHVDVGRRDACRVGLRPCRTRLAQPLTLSGHRGGVYAASFSPNGTRAVSAGHDRAVRVWHVFASERTLIETAQASLPRQLTDAQRAKYHLPPRSV